MQAKEINKLLEDIYNKDSTTTEEKKALLEASGCVWDSRMNKVVDTASFMNMLYNNMGFQYDVKVENTDKETIFQVKTFIKKEG